MGIIWFFSRDFQKLRQHKGENGHGMNNMESQMALITHRERGSEENGLKEVISVNKQEIPPVTPVATEATL